MALKLTMAFGDNPRIEPLRDGTVKPENIDLEIITVTGGMLFYRNLAYDEFDASEMSISETLLAKERREALGGGKWDWTPIPVFLSRGPWTPNLYVNTASGIDTLSDLKGKRIASPDYDMTAALWMRITLKDLYGIEARDNIWYNGRTKELSHGGLWVCIWMGTAWWRGSNTTGSPWTRPWTSCSIGAKSMPAPRFAKATA